MNTNPIQPPIKEESVTTEGIAADYVWYHSQVLLGKMGEWKRDFERVVRVMEEQRVANMRVMEDLLRINRELKEKLKDKEKT